MFRCCLTFCCAALLPLCFLGARLCKSTMTFVKRQGWGDGEQWFCLFDLESSGLSRVRSSPRVHVYTNNLSTQDARAMPCHAALHALAPCRAMLHCTPSRHAVPCYVLHTLAPCRAMLFYTPSRHAAPCYATHPRAMPCHALVLTLTRAHTHTLLTH